LIQGRLTEFVELTYPIRREGYRGCQRREGGEEMTLTDPLAEVVAKIRILSDPLKEGVLDELNRIVKEAQEDGRFGSV
jgi:hypothetical protein